MSIEKCRIIELPKIQDVRGNLTVVENGKYLPYEIKRIYYLYDVPGGVSRGGHAHVATEQFLVAISGSFDITLDDGSNKRTFSLNRAYYGLYVPTMVWREIDNFSSGAVCLSIVSTLYSEDDYIRDYQDFIGRVRP